MRLVNVGLDVVEIFSFVYQETDKTVPPPNSDSRDARFLVEEFAIDKTPQLFMPPQVMPTVERDPAFVQPDSHPPSRTAGSQ